jgi:lysophospholipase L1-like esterase
VTAGEIVSRTLGVPYQPYAIDGGTSEDLDHQWRQAASRAVPGMAMVSVGGNDLIQHAGMFEEYERLRFAMRLTMLLRNLRTMGIKAYVANIYDPTFGSNDRDFLGIGDKEAARRNYDALNKTIGECAALGVLVDLRAHFLKHGDESWFAFDIEPSKKGAEEIAKAFLEQIQA